ncbi:MAG: DUF424 family protein [archaeon]|nr:DUF424 family protein [archaeon]MCR4323670.1 DUF424 family protein [Nanoarchaeota archaeon]
MAEKNILLKVHDSYRTVVAICDKELLGKLLTEGIKQLDLTGPFFQGEEMSSKEVKKAIEKYLYEDATFNIVGENSIKLAKEMGIITEEGVLDIDGIPFSLVLV